MLQDGAGRNSMDSVYAARDDAPVRGGEREYDQPYGQAWRLFTLRHFLRTLLNFSCMTDLDSLHSWSHCLMLYPCNHYL